MKHIMEANELPSTRSEAPKINPDGVQMAAPQRLIKLRIVQRRWSSETGAKWSFLPLLLIVTIFPTEDQPLVFLQVFSDHLEQKQNATDNNTCNCETCETNNSKRLKRFDLIASVYS